MGGLSLVSMHGLLTVGLPVLQGTGSRACRLHWFLHMGSVIGTVVLWHVASSQTRDQTETPAWQVDS